MDKGHDTQDSVPADLKPLFWFFGGVALIIVLFLISQK